MSRRHCNRGFMGPLHASEDVIRWLESFLGPRREVKVGLVSCEVVKVEPMRYPMGVAYYQTRYGAEKGPLLGGVEKKPRKKRKKREKK